MDEMTRKLLEDADRIISNQRTEIERLEEALRQIGRQNGGKPREMVRKALGM